MGYSLAQACRDTMRAIAAQRPRRGPLLSLIVIAIILGVTLTACYVGPGPYPYRGWCYYHPYRC
jgi:hypothetical protein